MLPKIELIPVDHGFENKIRLPDTAEKMRTANWWSEDAPFTYPNMLVSTFYGKEKVDYRDVVGIPRKNFTLFGDSGGFQNSTRAANLNADNVFRWQEHNCDIGFILDYPIHPTNSTEIVEIMRNRTVTNANLILPKWTNKDFKLYAVLHGRNREELTAMIKAYGDLSQYSGIALGSIVPKKSDYLYIAQLSMIFAELVRDYKKPVHFFGVGGVNSIPIISYITQKYNLTTTTDAAGHGIGISHRKYWNPLNLSGNIQQFGDGKNGFSFHPENLPCDCPVCTLLGHHIIDLAKSDSPNTALGTLISLHNVYAHLRYTKMVKSYTQKDYLLKAFVNKFCTPAVNDGLEFIDYGLEYGIEKAIQKYTPTTSPVTVPVINQLKLF